MNATAQYQDSTRTPLAAGLSILLHGALVGIVVVYFYAHMSHQPPPTETLVMVPPPLSSEDSPDRSNQGGSPTTVPNILSTKLPPAEVSAPTPEPPTPQPPTPPKPTPPTPPKPSPTKTPVKTTPTTKPTTTISYKDFLAQQHMTAPQSASTSQSRPTRVVPNVTINTDGIVQGVEKVGDHAGGSKNGVAGSQGTKETDDYFSKIIARLKANFVPPPNISGLKASVSLTISASGKVLAAVITQKSGNPKFDAAVQDDLNSLTDVDPPPRGQETFVIIFQPDL